MTVAALNADLEAAREAVEQHFATLERIYARLILQAGREAATALVASAQVTPMVAATNEGATPDWQIPPEGVLFAMSVIAQRATKRLARLHRRIVRQVAAPPLARVGLSWSVTHPLSQALLESAGQRTGERLGLGVQDTLREVVAGAYAEGLPVRDAADLIRTKIGEAAPGQASMLARTDLNALSNGGSVMAAQMVGVTYKTWLTAEDDKVRETHADADGQTVPIDQPFDVGGESLEYPGDPAGSDEEVCNCRCSVIYADSLEGETASARPSGRVPSRQMARRPTFEFEERMIPRMTATRGGIEFHSPATGPMLVIRDRIPGKGFAAAATEPPLVAASGPEVSTLAMVALYPRVDEAEALADAGDQDADSIHQTLVFLGEAADVDAGTVAAVVAEMAALHEPLSGEVTGTAQFADGENGTPIVALPDVPGLAALRVHIADALDMAGIQSPSEHDFMPHLTLVYADEATTEGRDLIGQELHFDAVSVVIAGERVDYQLGSAGMTASAAGLAPTKPPVDWFATPEADQPTPLTVTADGQVYGHMALWDSCHTGYPGQCVPPPRSPSGYAYFNLGEVECADGSRVACGAITLEALHADTDRPLSNSAVRAHYEHTGVVGAYVRATDGVHGIWVAGALRANLSERHARDLMGAKPSGDWRQTRPGGPLEMLGVHAVNEPGYPVPRLVASALLPSGGRAVLEFAEPEGGRVPSRGFARVA